MDYDEYYSEETKITEKLKNKDLIRSFILKNLEKDKSILDVGCGIGVDTIHFKSLGYDIEGCDVSDKALVLAKERDQDIFFKKDFIKESTDKKYDIIYSNDVIEHIDDYDMFLQNIRESLKAGGKLILITPNSLNIQNRIYFLFGDQFFLNEKPHIRFFCYSSLKEILENNGFKIDLFEGGTKTQPTFKTSDSWLYLNFAGSLFVSCRKENE